jgi:hypothetical protein
VWYVLHRKLLICRKCNDTCPKVPRRRHLPTASDVVVVEKTRPRWLISMSLSTHVLVE